MLCFVKVIFLCKLNPFPFIKVGITKNLGQIQILSKSQLEQKQNDGRGGGGRGYRQNNGRCTTFKIGLIIAVTSSASHSPALAVIHRDNPQKSFNVYFQILLNISYIILFLFYFMRLVTPRKRSGLPPAMQVITP